MSPRIHVHIAELRVRGASPLEAQRLRDALAVELEREAAAWLAPASRSSFRPVVDGGQVRAPRRLERGSAALAEVVRRSMRP